MQVVVQDEGLANGARSALLRHGKGLHPAALNVGRCASHALAKARNLPLAFKGGDLSRTDSMEAS